MRVDSIIDDIELAHPSSGSLKHRGQIIILINPPLPFLLADILSDHALIRNTD